MDQSDMSREGRLSCCHLGTLHVDLSIWSRTISMPPRNNNNKKNQNLPEKKIFHSTKFVVFQGGACILRVHLRFTAFLCTPWGSSQSQSVGTLRICEAGFYQGSEWSLNKATSSFPPSWKAPDLGPKSRATGPVLFIFPLLWLASQILFLHKTVPYLFYLN